MVIKSRSDKSNMSGRHTNDIIGATNHLILNTTLPQSQILPILLGYHIIWEVKDIHLALCSFLNSSNGNYNDYVREILLSWFSLHGDKEYLLELVSIIGVLRKNQPLENELKLHLLRKSKLNPAKKLPNFAEIKLSSQIQSSKNISLPRGRRIVEFAAEYIGNLLNYTVIDIINSISISEFINCSWMKDHVKHQKAPNILKAIEFYNFLSGRFATEILICKGENQRAEAIDKVIDIASRALELHNYELCSAIVSSLNSHPISRLKKTWAAIPCEKMAIFKVLEESFSPVSNYLQYRTKLTHLIEEKVTFIPILSVMLRDIASIDVLPNHLSQDRLDSSSEGTTDEENTEKDRRKSKRKSHRSKKKINYDKIQSFGKCLYPLIYLQRASPTLSNHREIHSEENYSIIANLLKYQSASEDILLELSYSYETPKHNFLENDCPVPPLGLEPVKKKQFSSSAPCSPHVDSIDNVELADSETQTHSGRVSPDFLLKSREKEIEKYKTIEENENLINSLYAYLQATPPTPVPILENDQNSMSAPSLVLPKPSLVSTESRARANSTFNHLNNEIFEQKKEKNSSRKLSQSVGSPVTVRKSPTVTEKMQIIKDSASKNPLQWNKQEVLCNLEEWGLPFDLCESLSDQYIGNGITLIRFSVNKSLVPQKEHRRILKKRIKKLRSQISSMSSGSYSSSPSSPSRSIDIASWSADEVTAWVRESQIFQFESIFCSVDGKQLIKFTNQDLQDRGISSSEQRKLIIREIGKLVNQKTKSKRHALYNSSAFVKFNSF